MGKKGFLNHKVSLAGKEGGSTRRETDGGTERTSNRSVEESLENAPLRKGGGGNFHQIASMCRRPWGGPLFHGGGREGGNAHRRIAHEPRIQHNFGKGGGGGLQKASLSREIDRDGARKKTYENWGKSLKGKGQVSHRGKMREKQKGTGRDFLFGVGTEDWRCSGNQLGGTRQSRKLGKLGADEKIGGSGKGSVVMEKKLGEPQRGK